ncbi:Csc1 protein [Martiniozyma asiatica (nom. inval.)]|nr:Csc1 protein [Martiniozyma asiatica]
MNVSYGDTSQSTLGVLLNSLFDQGVLALDKPGEEPPIFDPRRQTQTLFRAQLYVCSVLGIISFLVFCFLRKRFPLLYGVRSFRNRKISMLPATMFGWVYPLLQINDEQLLQVIGLDSYVFLCFFRMCIKILFILATLGVCILSPIRYILTGSFDKDGNGNDTFINRMLVIAKKGSTPGDQTEPISYLAWCTFFTYIFTGVIYWFLFKETAHIIRTRQKFLGSQRSLTDRTIFVRNIPELLRDERQLKLHIEALSVGKVDRISFVHDYSSLVKLFNKRIEIVEKLEIIFSRAYGLKVTLFDADKEKGVQLKTNESCQLNKGDILYNPLVSNDPFDISNRKYPVIPIDNKKRFGKLRWFGNKIDLVDYYSRKLIEIDEEINHCKNLDNFKIVPHAFITMDSVTDAQMAAQAVFSPKVFELTTELAPAPLDVNWNNLQTDKRKIFLKRNFIEVVIITFSILLIVPIRYITSLLNVNSIKKMWEEFGDYLIDHDTARAVVTGLVPTYLFTLINVILPYVISFLSNLQGLPSKGDVELNVIKKNFLYIFFNLFLVFTLFGTLSSYKALLTDTTKIAPLLATSIKSLSLFYIDLILLQGLTMFPFKLLQIGDLFILFWKCIFNYKFRTPRMMRELIYKPSLFDLGLILPQHIMIFIITMIYSPLSTKILVSGFVYFVFGFYTYKYQLVYSMIHPYHSTGKAWPIIFKRVCLGVFVLHLQMFGSLALEQAFVLAGLMLPLFPATLYALFFFDRNFKPLLHYIALDAIKTQGQSVDSVDDELFEPVGGSTLTSLNRLMNSASIGKKKSLMSFDGLLSGANDNSAVLMCLSEDDTTPDAEENDQREHANNSRATLQLSDASKVYNLEQIDEESTYSDTNDESLHPLTPNNASPTKPGIPHHCRHRRSTIEEQRERSQNYRHPCLYDPLNGLIVGFTNDQIDYLDFKEDSGSVDDAAPAAAPAAANSNSDDANGGAESGDNNDNSNNDLESVPMRIKGEVIRKMASREIL